VEIDTEIHDITLAMASDVNILITGGDAEARTALACLIHQNHGPAGSFIVFSAKPARNRAAAQAMIRASSGGTLFIEELADLDTETQRELLRVVDARRAGAEAAAPRRVITAMGDNLQDRIASEPILGNLFYRLNLIHLVVEPIVPYARTWLM
jgi:DNA-binding NtrC family response regulator